MAVFLLTADAVAYHSLARSTMQEGVMLVEVYSTPHRQQRCLNFLCVAMLAWQPDDTWYVHKMHCTD
jgi:hypothetical protein